MELITKFVVEMKWDGPAITEVTCKNVAAHNLTGARRVRDCLEVKSPYVASVVDKRGAYDTLLEALEEVERRLLERVNHLQEQTDTARGQLVAARTLAQAERKIPCV